MLLANIVLARTLSVAEFGTFGFAIALATVLAIPVSGGLPILLTREVAGYSQKTNWGAYRGIVLAAYGWVAASCGLIVLGLMGWWLLAEDVPAGPLLVAFLLVPFLGLNSVRVGILKGLGRPVVAEAPQQVLQPAVMILGYLCLAWLGLSSAMSMLWWYLCVVIVVFGIASLILWWVQPLEIQSARTELDDLPRWRQSIVPLVMVSASYVLNAQIAILLLGLWGQDEAVAQLRVAERGAQLVVLPMHFINTIIGPYFVHAMHDQDPAALRRVTRQSVIMVLAISLPVAFILLLFGGTLIRWTFGPPYEFEAYQLMVIIIVAQFGSMVLGNGPMLLTMGGHERHALYGQIISLTVLIALGMIMIGSFGAVGAAIAVGAGVLSGSFYSYFAVRRKYGISPGLL